MSETNYAETFAHLVKNMYLGKKYTIKEATALCGVNRYSVTRWLKALYEVGLVDCRDITHGELHQFKSKQYFWVK